MSGRGSLFVCLAAATIALSPRAARALEDWAEQGPHAWTIGRSSHAMAYVGDDKVLMFAGYAGGEYQDSWIYDVSADSWSPTGGGTRPAHRQGHAMAYVGDNKVVMFGGTDPHVVTYSDTWVFTRTSASSGSWTSMNPTTHPPAMFGPGMVYLGGDQVLLFGGSAGFTNLYDQTWVYDLSDNTWTQKSPAAKPAARYDQATAYIGDDEVVVFGGSSNIGVLGDTWIYDLSDDNWTERSPVTTPGARYGSAMAYLGLGRAVLYGGFGSDVLGDTWVYSLSANTWVQDANVVNPPALMRHALAAASTDGSNYVVLFGGSLDWLNENYSEETWTFGGGDYPLNCPTWYRDADGDGFGDPALTQPQCTQPAGFVANASDCDDANPALGICNTPVSPDPVTFDDPAGAASVTLPNVVTPGDTTITSGACAAPPEGIFLTWEPICVDIETTATFEGDAEVCIYYDDTGLSLVQEQHLTMVRCPAAPPCQALPTSRQDTVANELCALTPAFSNFAVGTLTDVDGDFVPDLLDNCPATVNFFQEDGDTDSVGDVCDNCAAIANADQADGDSDAVGSVCDSCTTFSNPRESASFLSSNPWATLTGGQRDDDHDGFGTKCDAKFPGVTGTFVGTNDLTQFRASNTKDRAGDTCGTTGTRPCAIFDLDQTGTFIGSGDLTQFRVLNTKAPGPRCAACTGAGSIPLPCTAGTAGTCGPIP